MLRNEDFLTILKNTPLVSIDLLIPGPGGSLLMGRRSNEPARGTWFVPGGRIRKAETLPEAFLRISEVELGIALAIEEARLVGAFTHIYPTNYLGVEGVSTHYVALGYQLELPINLDSLPNDQHSAYRWIPPADEGGDPDEPVHENSSAYFACLRT